MKQADSHEPQSPGRLILTNEGMVWLGALLLLGMVGWFKSINLVLILAYMMAVLLILNGLLVRATDSPGDGRREKPDRRLMQVKARPFASLRRIREGDQPRSMSSTASMATR